MEKINILYDLFTRWVKTTNSEYIRKNPAAPFLNIDAKGQGFVGDDAGGIYFEFDTIADGIRQLQAVKTTSR